MAKTKPCADPRARARFLAALRRGASVALAARAAGVSFTILYRRRRASARFARAWARAAAAGQLRLLAANAGGRARWRVGQTRGVDHPQTRARFLDALAGGATVWFAAQSAGVHEMTLRRWRRRDPDFAVAWDAAYAAGTTALMDEAAARPFRGLPRAAFDGRATLRAARP